MDANFRFTYQSERFEEITGIPSEEVIGRTRDEAFDGKIDDAEKWTQQFVAMETYHPTRWSRKFAKRTELLECFTPMAAHVSTTMAYFKAIGELGVT